MVKRSLIAVCAIMAICSAHAESSVSLYGVIDTGYQFSRGSFRTYDHFGVQTSRTIVQQSGLTSGVLSSSSWGMKGEEKLGSGLSAVFAVEANFDSATGAFSEGFDSRSVVGLAGNFGTVLIGLEATPLDNWGFDLDGDTKSDVTYTETYSGLFYSGEFSGLTINAMLGGSRYRNTHPFNNVKTSETGYGLGLAYTRGVFSVGTALQQFRNHDAGLTTTRTEYGLGMSYDFGPFVLLSHYLASKNTITGGAYSKWEHANIGVSVPMGNALTLIAEFGRNRAKANNDSLLLGDIYGPITANFNRGSGYRMKGDGNSFMLGMDYNLSKNTDLYMRSGQNNSLDAKIYSTDADGTYLGKVKGRTNYIQIGMRHRF